MTAQILTQSRLKELLHYDPETGSFTWLVFRTGTATVGYTAGKISNTGYRRITIEGRTYAAHRLAFLYMTGELPVNDVDHDNRIRADNAWCNLKQSTRSQNNKNKKIDKRNTSGVMGVRFVKRYGTWIAQIGVDGQQIHLGCFKSKHKAIAVRKAAEVMYGYHKNHGK